MKRTGIIALCLVWLAGIITIVGSSLEEDRAPRPPPVPVTVQFELAADELDRKLGTRTDTISDLLFTGSYIADQGDKLTLDKDLLRLDQSGGFSLSVVPIDGNDELLTGLSEIVIGDDFDVGLSGNPDTGRFTSFFDSTTTTVMVTASGVDVLVEDDTNPTTTAYNWPDFESVEFDDNVNLHIRMASAAYNSLKTVMILARLTEDILDLVDERRIDLEGMFDQALSIPCDDAMASDARFDLFWDLNPSGSGQGEIGAGDEFTAEYSNCLDNDFGFYLQGDVELDNYDPADSAASGTSGVRADLNGLFLASAAIDGSPVLSNDSPRWDGFLSQSFTEQINTQ